MVWAIDLDDGSLIEALGSNLGRERNAVLADIPLNFPCLGSGRMTEL